jgi:hypothetical protein
LSVAYSTGKNLLGKLNSKGAIKKVSMRLNGAG